MARGALGAHADALCGELAPPALTAPRLLALAGPPPAAPWAPAAPGGTVADWRPALHALLGRR